MLQEGALTIQHDTNLSNRFWVSAIHTVNFVRNCIIHSQPDMSPYKALWDSKPKIDWLRTYGSKCWALIPKVTRQKGTYRSVKGTSIGYFDDSKAYKVWILWTQTVLKSRDIIFDESNHIERVMINSTDEDDLPDLWNDMISISMSQTTMPFAELPHDHQSVPAPQEATHELQTAPEKQTKDNTTGTTQCEPKPIENDNKAETRDDATNDKDNNNMYAPSIAPEDFEYGPWLDPDDEAYGRGKRCQVMVMELVALANGENNLKNVETMLVTLAEDDPESYREAMQSPNTEKWKSACNEEYNTLMGYHTWTLVKRPPNTNIMGSCWTFRVKRDNYGQVDRYKAHLVAQGFSQIPGLNFNETYAPMICLMTI